MWNDTCSNKCIDATILLKGMDNMLYKMANTKWKDVISRKDETDTDTLIYAKQDFEDFKDAVGKFTMTKVLDKDACDLKK